MALGGHVDGGGTADDPMIVGDFDEELQATHAQDKDNVNTQENRARLDRTRSSPTDAQARNERSPVSCNGSKPHCRNVWQHPTATASSSPTVTEVSDTQTTPVPNTFVGGHISVGVITAPTNANSPTAVSAGTQASVTFVAGVPPPGPYPAGPVNQRTRHPGEQFYLHPTNPMKLVAVIQIENPYAPGTYYEQRDEIPILNLTEKSPAKPKFMFSPNLEDAKIPDKHRGNIKNNHTPDLWTRHPDGSLNWTRPGRNVPVNHWKPIIVFRRFNSTTHKYEGIHLSMKKLNNIDPNNEKKYHHPFNKWLDQMKRRRDMGYVKTVSKTHWSDAERRELYRAVNNHVREWGLHMFGFNGVKMSKEQMLVMSDAINQVGGNNRKHDAVRGQLSSSHAKKNPAVFELMKRADAVRERIKSGEVIPRDQLHLEQAIPEPEFPVDPADKKFTKKDDAAETQQSDNTSTAAKTKKRSAAALEEEDEEEEAEDDDDYLSDPPEELDDPAEPRASLPTRSSPRTRSNKKPRIEGPATNDLLAIDVSSVDKKEDAQRSPRGDDTQHFPEEGSTSYLPEADSALQSPQSDDAQNPPEANSPPPSSRSNPTPPADHSSSLSWTSTDSSLAPKKASKRKASKRKGTANPYQRGNLTVAEAVALELEDEELAAAKEERNADEKLQRERKRKRKSGGDDGEVKKKKARKGGRK